MKEIERKFLIKSLPNLSTLTPWHSERFFLKNDEWYEERISCIQDRYYYDKKITISSIERNREKREIIKSEFDSLKSRAYASTIRDTYLLSEIPKITLQIYKGTFEWLVRVEVEFWTIEEANAFEPLFWMGEEITWEIIARDSSLLKILQDGNNLADIHRISL
jgi:CYTH domain-containing protein